MHTHSKAGRWRWADRSCPRVEWSLASEIDIRIYSDGGQERFPVWQTQGGSRYRGVTRMQSAAFVGKLPPPLNTNSHTHRRALTLSFVWRRCQVSVSKWEPLSGAWWAWDSVHVMDSWQGVCTCMWSVFCVYVELLDVCGGRGAEQPTIGRAAGDPETPWRTDPGTESDNTHAKQCTSHAPRWL